MLFIFVLVPVQLLLGPLAWGQAHLSLYLGAGKPGTESFELGVGITSLIKVRLLPHDGIDLTLVETADHDVAGDLLIAEQDRLATLTGYEPVTRSPKSALRSVMAFKRSDVGTGPSLELIARADVPADAVYFITKAILENGVFLEDLNQRSWGLSADQALVGLNLPLHSGAIRYFEEIGEANLSADAAIELEPEAQEIPETLDDDSTFLVDFGADTATLDLDAQRQIAEACQYASIFDAARIEVAGHAGLNGSNNGAAGSLAGERVRYVVDALRANAGCAETEEIVAADPSAFAPLDEAAIDGHDSIQVFIMLPR